MTVWRLRFAGKGDADLLAALESSAFGPAGWGARGVADGLAGRLSRTLVAEDDEANARGFLMWRRLGDEAEILTLAVAPQWRRRGCARALVDAVLGILRSEGARSLFLEVDAGNAAAIALYEGRGFHRIARRKRYYRSGADALVMRVDL
jgi:ribosomal-protein-alanine N-acetyltransferase